MKGLSLSYEEAKALYFDEALIAPQQLLRRVRIGGDERYYFIENTDGSRNYFVGVTSASKLGIPTSPFLIEWMISKGSMENARYEASKAAAYGTNMHIVCLQMFLLGEKLKMEDVDAQTLSSANSFGLPDAEKNGWIRETRRDLLAFAQFVEDYKVKPIAVEFPIASPTLGIGGTIDFPCYMTIKEKGFFGEVYKSGDNKGQPKETSKEREIIAIVDLKSGRKGFYEEHEFQLESYRRMWDSVYPDYKVERIYDWSPKEWKTSPSYTLQDQTGGLYSDDIAFNAVLSIALRKAKKPENHRELQINEEIVRSLPISDQFQFVSIEQMEEISRVE